MVAINQRWHDTVAELAIIEKACKEAGAARAVIANHWAEVPPPLHCVCARASVRICVSVCVFCCVRVCVRVLCVMRVSACLCALRGHPMLACCGGCGGSVTAGSRRWQGGYGAIALAEAVREVCKEGKGSFKLLYPDSLT